MRITKMHVHRVWLLGINFVTKTQEMIQANIIGIEMKNEVVPKVVLKLILI